MSDQLETRKVQLIHDLRTVIRDTQALMHAAMADGKDGSEMLKKTIASELGEAMERLQRLESDVSDAFRHSAQRTKHYVQTHPVQAVGISAGIGLLIGLWIKRRQG